MLESSRPASKELIRIQESTAVGYKHYVVEHQSGCTIINILEDIDKRQKDKYQ